MTARLKFGLGQKADATNHDHSAGGTRTRDRGYCFRLRSENGALSSKRILARDGAEMTKDSVEIDVGTPVAKAFLDRLMSEPFFNRRDYAIATRQPRALVATEEMHVLARPLFEPSTDLFEELWQFS